MMSIHYRRYLAGLVIVIGLLGANTATAMADTLIGPGNIPINSSITHSDVDYNLLAVDLTDPTTLGAGTYIASQFNYQFVNVDGGNPTGSITPIVLIGGGSSFTPVAVGSAITYAAPTTFLSTSFGPSDTFTLSATTTVYAGLYWNDPTPAANDRMPISYDTDGSSFLHFGSANPPLDGTAISGGSDGTFTRAYDFSVDVTNAAPLPSSLELSMVGFAGVFGLIYLCRNRTSSLIG